MPEEQIELKQPPQRTTEVGGDSTKKQIEELKHPQRNNLEISSDQLPSNVKRHMEELLQETKQAKAQKRAAEEQLAQILQAVRENDPNAAIENIATMVRQQKEAEQREKELKSAAAAAAAAAEARAKDTYESRLRELQSANQQLIEEQEQARQNHSLYKLFVSGEGINYEYFKTLLGVEFRPKFDENGELVAIEKSDGTPIYYDNGTKPATPQEVLLEMRKGTHGGLWTQLFNPYNQSRGANIPPGVSGGNNQLVKAELINGIPIIGRKEIEAIREKRYIK